MHSTRLLLVEISQSVKNEQDLWDRERKEGDPHGQLHAHKGHVNVRDVDDLSLERQIGIAAAERTHQDAADTAAAQKVVELVRELLAGEQRERERVEENANDWDRTDSRVHDIVDCELYCGSQGLGWCVIAESHL